MSTGGDGVLWRPSPERLAGTHMRAFAEAATRAGEADAARGDGTVDYEALRRWSIDRPERFWPMVWRYGSVVAQPRTTEAPWDRVLVGGDRMAPPDPVLGPRWFPGAQLNFVENLLRLGDDREAVVSWNERGRHAALTWAQLRAEVARAAGALRAQGIRPGDRVAGFMPNIPETIVAMLGAATLGAIWSSCSPDFGVKGVLDRFGQIAPRVLVAADGYLYGGKEIDSLPRVREITRAIGEIERVVVVPYRNPSPSLEGIRGAVLWSDWLGGDAERVEASAYPRFPFDHPLYIMYSSGTTGLPKCMVHGAGGTLLQHLKEHLLHTDVHRDDRVFYFTTCGWMMWNWLVSVLATGATVVLYDGSPLAPRRSILWRMAEAERVSIFGTSAKYLALAEKEGLEPGHTHDLSALRTILSTGSPLAPPASTGSTPT